MPIHYLPSPLVAKIAAGEVIERPCYAVKELIENAIDASATAIEIHIQNAGLDSITVIDNGEGIPYDELPLTIERHTTSKINSEDDLMSIKTLGFRGEALASIAAVSKLTLRSKAKDGSKGGLLQSTYAQLNNVSPIGLAQGTQVVVENLFGSLPARKKFFKSTALEYRYILEQVTAHALTHPDIQWSLTHNDKHIFRLFPNQTTLERIAHLLGTGLSSQCLPIHYTSDYCTITGYLAKPQISTHTTQKQYIFLNNRRIYSLSISNTARSTYGSLLEATAHPLFIINIELKTDQYDVNVHPRKETVFFYEQEKLLEHIKQAFSQTMTDNSLTYIENNYPPSPLKDTVSHQTAQILREKVLTQYYATDIKKTADIIQLHNTYLITETAKGILIVDQHAAHERVLYEKFLEAFNNQKQQSLSVPRDPYVEISLSLADHELLLQHIQIFIKLGFKIIDGIKEVELTQLTSQIASISPETSNRLYITHLPEMLKDHPIETLLLELLDDLREDKTPSIDIRSHRMLSYLACRSAIMAGDKLSKDRARLLLDELSQCQTEYTCPHGRPVKVELPLNNMHKLFKRL